MLETVTFKRELTLIVDDTALLILNIAVSTRNFSIEGLIEKAYRFVSKSLLEKGNYLGSDSIKELLIPYVVVSSRRKNKNKLPLVSLPLIVSEESKDSVSYIILV